MIWNRNGIIFGVVGLVVSLGLIMPAAGKSEKSAKAGKQEELAVGASAPKTGLKMADSSGRQVSLNSSKGKKGLLVIFSCNTCPFVVAWEDRYPKLAEQAGRLGIGMIVVNSNEALRDRDDSPEAMKAHATEKGYTFPYAVDRNSELADAFGAGRTPHVFLLDKNLKLVYRGAIDDNKSAADVKAPYLSDAMESLAAGRPIAVSSTKSIGCGIKRKS